MTQMCPIVSAIKDLRFHPQRVGLFHVFLRLNGFYASNVKDGGFVIVTQDNPELFTL